VLTRRELQVATLVSRGSTDPQIADALVIAPHTAHQHIRNILKKLGVRSRVQIAAWAIEAGVQA
jgi:DNA-binding NarL/FixJ family response regulator